ncbi:MAG: hypothetical protein H6644_05685 [Caldilineaceae bacterium]|nr:hypothetical protein [Caldilineaceae bacterium]
MDTNLPATGPLTILKLGGALLTDKTQPYTLRPAILAQAVDEVRACRVDGLIERLIVVHGVGSFGHPPVVEHKLHKGFQAPDQLIHLTDAQNRVMELRMAAARACHQAGLPVATIMPSSCMTADSFVRQEMFLDAVDGFLRLGMIPLLGGDVLVDRRAGFSVHSGDAIAVELALHFDATRLVFATAVDGIYDRDPAQDPAAVRLAQFSLGEAASGAAQLARQARVDASGAMAGKLDAVRRAAAAMDAGLRVDVISMLVPGNLTALLRGEDVGTRVIAG